MAINRDKPDRWKQDIALSIDLYNNWFLEFAPEVFRRQRVEAMLQVQDALRLTGYLTNINADTLLAYAFVLPMLRMTTCPPIARDRLIGLSGISAGIVNSMETEGRIPPKMSPFQVREELRLVARILMQMADHDLFVWLDRAIPPTEDEINRAVTIVADRLCGAQADTIIRNAQERRQLSQIESWLQERGYRQLEERTPFDAMLPGTFAFRVNVPVRLDDGNRQVNIPVDAVVMPRSSRQGDLPILIEAKSAGDFTNVNKRRKEEAMEMSQLRTTYGARICYILFLCGYFDSGYLGYEASEGIDWVWEHRSSDLAEFGL